MKKLLLLLLVLAGGVSTASADDYGWYDASMKIGGVTTVPFSWSTSDDSPTDLGVVTNMTVESIAFKVWSDANDRVGANMYFRIWDGGSSQVGIDQDLWLGPATRISGDHDFSISWSDTFDLATAVGLGLEDGKTYYIDVWAKTYGGSGDEWYSGGGRNFHAKLTYKETYTRSVTSGNYGTICLPFSGTVSGATLYTIDSKIEVEDVLKGINISEAGTSLTAGQAYIFKASSSTLTVTDLTGDYTAAATGGAIVGNYESSYNVATGKFIIKDNKLWEAGTSVTIGQYRAYIDLSKVDVATSRGANCIYFGNDATGIESVLNDNNENVMFNLQGQRITEAQKGLVIIGGKKLLRK